MRPRRITVLSGFVGIVLLVSQAVYGNTYLWQGSNGEWSLASNWGGTLPTANDEAFINNGGTATLTTLDGNCDSLSLGDTGGSGFLLVTGANLYIQSGVSVGYSGAGTVFQTGGSVTAPSLTLGNNSGSSGTYGLSGAGASLLACLSEYIGYCGTGIFMQSGGTNSCGNLTVGSNTGTGTYVLSGTGQCLASNLVIGSLGLVQVNGGSLGVANFQNQGQFELYGGTLNINGSGLTNQGVIDCGNQPATIASSNAILDFSTGTLQNTRAITLNLGPNSLLIVPSGFDPAAQFGRFTSLGLTHAVGTTLNVPAGQGFNGQGNINDPVVCGGTISCSTLNLNGPLNISGSGVVDLGGGSLVTSDGGSGMTGGSLLLNSQTISHAAPNFARFSQSAGTYQADNLQLAISPNSRGAYTLSGMGTMFVNELVVGYYGIGTFQQSGGTVTINSPDQQTLSRLVLGIASGAVGNYSLSGNSLLHAVGGSTEEIWTGTFSQTGGTNIVDNELHLYNGTYSLSGASHLSASQVVTDGTFNQTGGLSSIANGLTVGSYNAAAAYNLNAGTLQIGYLSGFGALNLNGGLLQLTESSPFPDWSYPSTTIVLSPGPQTIDTCGNDVQIAATVQGTGKLVKVGNGTLILPAGNTFNGNTLISAGALALGSSLALQQSTLDTSGSGALIFGSLTNATFGGLTGSGTLNLTNDSYSPLQLSVGNNNADTTYSGTLTGGGLTKIGTGSFTLTGTNCHAGPTTVSSGVLIAGAANSLSRNSDMIVNGGTLDASAFANTVASLNISKNGSLNLGLGRTLNGLGFAILNGTLEVSGTGVLGSYPLLTYTCRTGAFASVAGLDSNYGLLYNANGTELDAVHKAQIGSFAVNTAGPTVIVGGQTDLMVSVANSAPVLSDELAFTATPCGAGFTSSASGSLAADSGGSFTIAGGFDSSALTPGTYTSTITLTGSNNNLSGTALNSGGTQNVTVTVLGHSGPALSVRSGSGQTVIVGARIAAGLSLSNGIAGEVGLASLDVNSLGTGVIGPTGGAAVASGSSQGYIATFNTNTLGPQTQTFSLNAGDNHTLPGASSPATISTTASLTVFDHANASLSATANQTTQTVNFGNLLRGATVPSQTFTMYNRAANTSAAYTANLKLASFSSSGDASFSTNLAAFSGLTANSGSNGYTFTASLNTASDTTTGINTIIMSAAQLADDSSLSGAGGNNNGALSVALVGTVGSATADASNLPGTFGPASTAQVDSHDSYANLESTVKSMTGSGGSDAVGTTATILAGTNSTASDKTVSMQWRTRTSGADAAFASDILDLSGMSFDGSGQADTFVLQMSYDAARFGNSSDEELTATDQQIGLDWFNPATGKWENAIRGNFGTNLGVFHLGPWQPDDMTLGDWGVDTTNDTVWAVLNHNSEFAVVPEPSTLGLLAIAAVGLLCRAVAFRRRAVTR